MPSSTCLLIVCFSLTILLLAHLSRHPILLARTEATETTSLKSTSQRLTSLPYLPSPENYVSYTGYLSFNYGMSIGRRRQSTEISSIFVQKTLWDDQTKKQKAHQKQEVTQVFTPYLMENRTERTGREKKLEKEIAMMNNRLAAHLFYWYWPMAPYPVEEGAVVDEFDESAPLFIVLGGGGGSSVSLAGGESGSTGCSFMSRLFFESGPVVLSRDDEQQEGMVLKERQISEQLTRTWNRLGHVLYIDAPVMTGYSYVEMKEVKKGKSSTPVADGIPKRAQLAALDLYFALDEFMALYPRLNSSSIYFVTSEYESKTVLYLNQILKTIKSVAGVNSLANVQLMGNVLFDPILYPSIQYPTIVPYNYMRGILSYGDTVRLSQTVQACLSEAQSDKIVNCESFFTQATRSHTVDARDSRIIEQYRDLGQLLLSYMNDSLVLDTLQVKAGRFQGICNTMVYDALKYDMHTDVPHSLLPELMDTYNVPFLFSSDQFNMRSNSKGVQEMLRSVPWSGRQQFNSQKATALTAIDLDGDYDGRLHGSFKSFNGLTQHVAFNGIHRTAELEKEFTNQDYFNSHFEVLKRYSTKKASTNALCDINDESDCVTEQLYCPNRCSNHGECVMNDNTGIMQCQCRDQFKGPDCSISEFNYDKVISARPLNETLSGLVHGKETHIYKLKLRTESKHVNLHLRASVLDGTGTIALLVNISDVSQAEKDDEEVKRRSWQYLTNVVSNNNKQDSDRSFRYFASSSNGTLAMDVYRGAINSNSDSVVTIAVMNTDHTAFIYQVSASVEPLDTIPYNLPTIFFALSVLLFVVVLVQGYMVVYLQKKQEKEALNSSRAD